MKNGLGLLPAVLVGLVFFSCGTGNVKTPDARELIRGYWKLDQAEMNGEDRSDRMRGTFFDFKSDSTVSSNFNLAGTPEEYSYTVGQSGIIEVTGGFSPAFRHDFLGTDSLILETFLQSNRIRFFLLRSEKADETNSPPGISEEEKRPEAF